MSSDTFGMNSQIVPVLRVGSPAHVNHWPQLPIRQLRAPFLEPNQIQIASSFDWQRYGLLAVCLHLNVLCTRAIL